MKRLMIFGWPRSGTSWLGTLFDSHPETLYLHEPDVTVRCAEMPFVFPDGDYRSYAGAVCGYVDRLAATRHLRAVSSIPRFSKSYRHAAMGAVRDAMLGAARSLEYVARAFGGLRRLPIPDFAFREPGMVVMKSVDSLGRLPAFAAACPDMPVVHIVRHPCGVVASKLKGIELGKFSDAAFHADHANLAPARRRGATAEDIAKLDAAGREAWAWMIVNEWAMDEAEKLPNVRLVSYDALCADPVGEMRALFDWAGLDWVPTTEAFLASNLKASGKSRYYSIRQNPAEAASRWRKQLSPETIAQVEGIAAGSRPGALFGL